ncbi:MAG: amidase [Pseudomonadota bacterium]
MKDSVLTMPAYEIRQAFCSHQLSPVEVMQQTLEQCRASQPRINALTDVYEQQAMEQALESERRYQSGDERPLEGLPLAVKDEFAVTGTRRTSSSLVYRDRTDNYTDEIITRLLDAGAICHAKTTTPEFCLLGACHSRLWGITRNPWNPDLTPGGSSGGSGAALASGMATLAMGTDIGGSIRIPAAQCGLAGYKAPYGRNPEIPIFNLDFYSHSGPMARSVHDIAMMQNTISGFYNRDIASLREHIVLDVESRLTDLSGWNIAYSLDLGYFEIDSDVETNTLAAVEKLRDLGARCEPVELGWTDRITDAVYAHWAFKWASGMKPLMDTNRESLTDYAIYFLQSCESYTAADYAESTKIAVEMYDTFGPMMDQFDAFICPTLATNRVPADFTWPASEVEVNGKTEPMIEEKWSMTYPFNILSRCPVLQIPSGLADNGTPTGIQIVGKTFDDRTVIELGKVLESTQDECDWPVS